MSEIFLGNGIMVDLTKGGDGSGRDIKGSSAKAQVGDHIHLSGGDEPSHVLERGSEKGLYNFKSLNTGEVTHKDVPQHIAVQFKRS